MTCTIRSVQMVPRIQFQTRRADYPPNMANLTITAATLYFSLRAEVPAQQEAAVAHLALPLTQTIVVQEVRFSAALELRQTQDGQPFQRWIRPGEATD